MFFGVFSRTWDTLGNALRGRDPETLLELLTAGKEGAKLAAMLGIPAIAVNTAIGKLSDPLRQVWEEANREIENPNGEGYNRAELIPELQEPLWSDIIGFITNNGYTVTDVKPHLMNSLGPGQEMTDKAAEILELLDYLAKE